MSRHHGTAVAVLSDGTHRVVHGTYPGHADFRGEVREALRPVRREVAGFFYAYDTESQKYTAREFLEVYFDE
jgi:hypothetical protein